jgi:hypothetical protein
LSSFINGGYDLFEKFKKKSAVSRLLEEKLYEKVLQELTRGHRRDGLWAKAISNSNGTDGKTKALYIKYRVQSIKDQIEISGTLAEEVENDFNKPVSNTYLKKNTVKKPSTQSNKDILKVNENELYQQVWQEFEENKVDIGLWTKCFSTCEGDENKTKALYVSKRVLILKDNLQKQIIYQERKAKEEAEKKIERHLASQKLAKKLLAFEGRTDDIFAFKKTIETMPTFFPKILDKFGYKLVQDQDRQEKWSIHLPSGTGVQYVYNLLDLRIEIRRILEKETALDDFIDDGLFNLSDKKVAMYADILLSDSHHLDKDFNRWVIHLPGYNGKIYANSDKELAIQVEKIALAKKKI